jgi:hypothetical protein
MRNGRITARLAVWLAAYAAIGTLAAVTCHRERAAQLEAEQERLEAPLSDVGEACPDSLLSTGCHPAWELAGWTQAREDSLQLEAERAYRTDAGCAPDFTTCHFGAKP